MLTPTKLNLENELSLVFPANEDGRSELHAYVDLTRSPKRSGSDIVVEEDLAIIFGRGKVEPVLETVFRHSINSESSETPLFQTSSIHLRAGPSPPIARAL
ncbi:MAG: hypothetical protein M1814_006389 [Vezdaea aestivalis]|nr:MAG: hypothetical protein M1814_006389 [Vezdaea aestivalis]